MHHTVVAVDIEHLPVASRTVFDEFGHPRDRRGARTGQASHFAIAEAFAELAGNLKALAPRLQLTEGSHIPEEIRHFLFALARNHRLAESTEPGFLAIGIFGEALSSRHMFQAAMGIFWMPI